MESDISIVIPTYNESENIRRLIPAIAAELDPYPWRYDIWIVDDGSPDGTADDAQRLSDQFPVYVIRRTTERGLASAVLAGFKMSTGKIVVVMDADFSHPVSVIPALVRPLLTGESDIAVGTRYCDGGGTFQWSLIRQVVSRGAGFLARKLTPMSDPTTGLMACRRHAIDFDQISPIGWKIVLEVVAKHPAARLVEVPFIFGSRTQGESKLDWRAQWDYIRHLVQLWRYRKKRIHG